MSTGCFLEVWDVIAVSQVSVSCWRAVGKLFAAGDGSTQLQCGRDQHSGTFYLTEWDDREFEVDGRQGAGDVGRVAASARPRE